MFDRYLITVQRRNGTNKPATIIDPNKYVDFFNALKDAKEIPINVKAFLAVTISGGLRVSEGLSLKVSDYDPATERFTVSVLKKPKAVRGKRGMLKAHPVNRTFELLPAAVEILKEYIKTENVKYFSFLFPFSRQYAYQRVKEIFGNAACPHSIARHTHISWLHREGKDVQTIARMMEISSTRIVESYAHVNQNRELDSLYSKYKPRSA